MEFVSPQACWTHLPHGFVHVKLVSVVQLVMSFVHNVQTIALDMESVLEPVALVMKGFLLMIVA